MGVMIEGVRGRARRRGGLSLQTSRRCRGRCRRRGGEWRFFLFLIRRGASGSTAAAAQWVETQCTVGQNNQKYGLEYWAPRSSVCSFTRTTHWIADSGLLAWLAPSAALPLHSGWKFNEIDAFLS